MKPTATTKAGGRTASFTERLARSSATHPWRTLGAWVTIIVVAVLGMSALPGNGLTSESKQHGRQPDSTICLLYTSPSPRD